MATVATLLPPLHAVQWPWEAAIGTRPTGCKVVEGVAGWGRGMQDSPDNLRSMDSKEADTRQCCYHLGSRCPLESHTMGILALSAFGADNFLDYPIQQTLVKDLHHWLGNLVTSQRGNIKLCFQQATSRWAATRMR